MGADELQFFEELGAGADGMGDPFEGFDGSGGEEEGRSGGGGELCLECDPGEDPDFVPGEGVEGLEEEADAWGLRGRRRQAVQSAIEEAATKRFSPVEVDNERCLARVCNHWRGGQCYSKRRPGSDLCGQRAKGMPYGLVTGPIPPSKLTMFLAKERQRILSGGEAAGAQGPRRADEKPKQG